MLNDSRPFRCLLLLTLLPVLAACGDSDSPTPVSTTYPDTPRTVFGGERPATLQVPTTYTSSHPAPLVVILHGYGADGFFQAQYLKLPQFVESAGVLLIAPDGTVNSVGSHFWNATPACCNFDGSSVDDVGYIRGLISDIRHDYNVDRRRIYVVGHSNGGFMAHRLACEASTDIAAIVSLAGATFDDAAACTPAEPVSVLDIHGDADATIAYEGAQIGSHPYPSESETMAHWQVYDRCTPGLVTDSATLNLELRIAGNETTIQRFNGCARSTDVELWTIQGGGHIPTLTRDFGTSVWQWLNDHPKS